MKNRLFLFLLSLMMTTFSACSFRDIDPSIAQDTEVMLMTIDVDWSDMEEKPTGMTILFYPSDNKLPIMRLTNNVDHYECVLPDDDYTILVFNQSENEFASLKFSGLESLNTSGVFVIDDPNAENRIDRLYKIERSRTRAKTAVATMKNNIGAAVKKASTRAKTAAASMKSNRLTNKMSVTVEVENLVQTRAPGNDVVAVNGALTGLASGFLFGQNKYPDESLTQELDDWEIHYATDASGIGYVHTEFIVFGISPLVGSGKTTLTEEDLKNILYLNFRLADGTYVPFRFEATDRIIEHTISGEFDTEIKLELHIGVKIPDVDDGLDNPIVLPEEGLPYGGFHFNISDWGAPVEQNITLTK